MLTWEDDVEVHALRNVAGRSRRSPGTRAMTARRSAPTCPASRTPGVRARPAPDPFEPFVDYCRERLVEDPHLWARTLFDELVELGFELSYPTLTRQIRARGLRPACEACRTGHRSAEGGDRAPAG